MIHPLHALFVIVFVSVCVQCVPFVQFRGDHLHTGNVPSSPSLNATTAQKHWITTLVGPVAASPVVGDRYVFCGDYGGNMHALDKDTGDIVWTFPTSGVISNSPILHTIGGENVVTFGSGDGILYSVATESAKLVRRLAATNGSIVGSPLLITRVASGSALPVGTYVYGSYSGYVVAVHPTTGAILWRAKLPASTASTPAYDEVHDTIVIGCNDYNLYVLKASDGTIKLTMATEGLIPASPTILIDSSGVSAIIVGSYDTTLYSFNGQDGSVNWAAPLTGSIHSSTALSADGKTVYVGTNGGNVFALSTLNGVIQWVFGTNGPVLSSPIVVGDGSIVVGSADATVYGIEPTNGDRKWTYTLGMSKESSPAVDGSGVVYIGCMCGALFSIGTV